ncbi:MAG TPA: glycosyltransferase family 39 protein [Gemmatimonadaceae bacterium]|nr:glycosyltransferase family 39 protein [Gemmatimonadaceae bacterium]
MFLPLLVLLALAEGYRRTRHRIAAVRPRLAPAWRELRADWANALRGVAWWEWASLAAATALALALRLRDLHQPIRYDEAATWLDYASKPLLAGLSDYRFPNNHLFHTLLVHVSAALFGDSPAALRIPALVAGVLLIPLTWGVARAYHSPAAATLAATLAATSASLVLYSTNARGYTIVCCLTMAIALLAARQRTRDNVAGWLAIALLAALGAWTIPIMLYPLLGIALWLWAEARAGDALLDARTMRARLGWTGAVTAACCAILYMPVIARSGIGLVVGNRFVRPQSRSSFFAALPNFYALLWEDWTRGWPVWLALVVAAGALVALFARHAGKPRIPLFGAALAAATTLLVVNGRVPYLRVWLFLLPLLIVAAGGGLAWLGARALAALGIARDSTIARATLLVGAGALGIAGATSLVRSDVVRRADDTGTLRDGAAIAALLARDVGPRDRVIATAPTDVPLAYHLQRLHLAHDLLRATPDSAPRLWVVVNDADGQRLPELLDAAQVMTIDFAAPRLVARLPEARVFALDRVQPGCGLDRSRCR